MLFMSPKQQCPITKGNQLLALTRKNHPQASSFLRPPLGRLKERALFPICWLSEWHRQINSTNEIHSKNHNKLQLNAAVQFTQYNTLCLKMSILNRQLLSHFRWLTLQESLTVSTFSADTCSCYFTTYQSNRWVHHALLELCTLWLCLKWNGMCLYEMGNTYITLLACQSHVYQINFVNSWGCHSRQFLISEKINTSSCSEKIFSCNCCWKWYFWISQGSVLTFERCGQKRSKTLVKMSMEFCLPKIG